MLLLLLHPPILAEVPSVLVMLNFTLFGSKLRSVTVTVAVLVSL
ncbi:hypothetical protein EVA_12891 [gut metagenome]|uniref:Uncharacterized protein n=1 Tax=gut metagenome TaxID=749906 RepID=J9FVG9_9ZZZZ